MIVTPLGIKRLLAKHSKSQIGSMNIAIPIKGKDRVTAPIPFNFTTYVTEIAGDTMVRPPEGDTYHSTITLYSLDPIKVSYLTIKERLSPEEAQMLQNENINDATFFTFGFLNCNFTIFYDLKFYRIMSQRKVYNAYYALTAALSI